jgi:CheY-like chemotaxis protein/HPt (histidine-containing phosphotransfer) domain-containing protein
MVTLLNDILDYSKIEKGAIDIEYIPFALRVLVRSVATLMSGRAKEKGLQIIVDINDDIPDNFQGDPNRLRQVLLNLVGNAIKFTQSGHITIKVSSDAVSNASITLRFDIIDTGIGISIDAQSQLFKPYAQADASISRRFGGTGLGLNICRMLVTAMKGSIGLESTEGRGSDFWFTLPLTIEEAIDPASPEILENTAPQRALNVLLIDDNVVNLKVTAGLMEKEGHHVITADSGQKALDLLVQNHFDVVFVDMLMPDMDGKEFIGKMRENPALGKLPVFALTGMSDKESQQKMMRLSVQDVFTKPVSRQTLQKALNKIAAIPEPIKELSAEDILSKIHELPADQQKLILQALKIEAPVVLSPPPVVTPSPVAPAPVAVPVPEQPAPVYTPPPPVPVVKPAIVEELPPVKATRKTEDTVTHIHADPAVEEEPEYEEEPEITPEPEETVEPMPEYELEQKPEPKQKKEPEIINLVMLADLKNSLPPETFKEIFDELIDKAKELMQLIQEALRDEDMDDLTEKAHNLKGMAGNFGLTYLMKYAAELENYGRHYEKEKAAKMIPISRPVLDKTLTALEQWIKTH